VNIVQKKFVYFGRLMDRIKTGYNQGAIRRWSVLDRVHHTLIKMKEVDCSAAFAILAWLAGIPWDLKTGTSTRNIAQKARATGMYNVDHFDGDLSKLRPGGALLEPGHHIASMLDHGEMLSPEQTELHTTTGGKPGEQASYEVRIRKAYKRRSGVRNGGWTYIINLKTVAQHARAAILAFVKNQNWSVHIKRMSIVAPHDGPLLGIFLDAWRHINMGMSLSFVPLLVARADLAIVVLGTKLNPDGTVSKKFVQRLQLALAQANANPGSIVIVSGSKPYNGVTEAAAGRNWLVDNGLSADRVFKTAGNSTVGNATSTVPEMIKMGVHNYVLVSHASHLRRASIDFLAAILKWESDTNKVSGLFSITPLAIDDYKPNPVKTSGPVSDSDRAAMAAEVLTILGL